MTNESEKETNGNSCCCCCCCCCCGDVSSREAVQLLRGFADVLEDVFVEED